MPALAVFLPPAANLSHRHVQIAPRPNHIFAIFILLFIYFFNKEFIAKIIVT